MVSFNDTRAAGRRAEQEVLEAIRPFTRHVYSNVKVDTLLTKSGITEIDIVFAVADVVVVVEVKNVLKLEGAISDNYWTLTGLESGQSYSTLSPLVQNRIHVHSLKNAWHAAHGDIPVVISCVVVPNGCTISEEQAAAGVMQVGEFYRQLSEIFAENIKCRYGYTLDYLCGNAERKLTRPDFVRRV